MIRTSNEIKRKIRPVLQEYGVRRAVLFGSYAKGTSTERSDIDLLLDSGLKGLSFVGLIEDIREALDGCEVDAMDITHVEKGSRIEEEIKRTGVLIYET